MNTKINSIENQLDKPLLLQALLIALMAQTVSFFMFAPEFRHCLGERFTSVYEPLSHNPWTRNIVVAPQTRHRILGPMIAYYSGLRGVSTAIVPVLGGTLMLLFSYLALRRVTDHRWASWTTFLIATTQTIISSQTWFGYQDALGGAAVAACFFLRQPWWAALILFVGMLGDERCAAAIPFIIIWQFDNGEPHRWKRSLMWVIFLCIAVALWLAYFWYARHYFLPDEVRLKDDFGGTSFQLIRENHYTLPFGFFESIRGGWIIIGYAIYIMTTRRKYLLALCCLFTILACLIQAGLVFDISRTSSVLWPMLLIAAREIYRHSQEQSMILLKTSVILNLLSPCCQMVGKYVLTYYPFPISITFWLFGA